MPLRDGHDDVPRDYPDEVISRVGRAAAQVAVINEGYAQRAAELQSDEERNTLTQRVEQALVQVISDEGLSVDEYNNVVLAAKDDPVLGERLATAVLEAE